MTTMKQVVHTLLHEMRSYVGFFPDARNPERSRPRADLARCVAFCIMACGSLSFSITFVISLLSSASLIFSVSDDLLIFLMELALMTFLLGVIWLYILRGSPSLPPPSPGEEVRL